VDSAMYIQPAEISDVLKTARIERETLRVVWIDP
jgi:hypothetical protein